MSPFRNLIPIHKMGVDLSPMLVLFLLQILQSILILILKYIIILNYGKKELKIIKKQQMNLLKFIHKFVKQELDVLMKINLE